MRRLRVTGGLASYELVDVGLLVRGPAWSVLEHADGLPRGPQVREVVELGNRRRGHEIGAGRVARAGPEAGAQPAVVKSDDCPHHIDKRRRQQHRPLEAAVFLLVGFVGLGPLLVAVRREGAAGKLGAGLGTN